MKKNGFTLIELLAVIIILGILMIIAIPSVTKYINDSRKSAYIDTAKQVASATKNLVNSGKLEMYDTSVAYYIPNSCIKVENGEKAKSPYGEFIADRTYVVVTYDGKGYDYYWVSLDETGTGVKEPISIDKLEEKDIETDLTRDDVKDNNGVGKNKVVIFNSTCEASIPKDAYSDSIITTILDSKESQLRKIDENIYIFIGENPDNYVKFNCDNDGTNCEIWRIIGIYEDKIKIQNTNGITEQKYNNSTNDGNNWDSSRLNNYLNKNEEGGYYYSLKPMSKNMIVTGTWNTGSVDHNTNAIDTYNDSKTNTWIGKIGIVSSYEFLYAASGDNCPTIGYYVDFYNNCGGSDWLRYESEVWTLSTPKNSTLTAFRIFPLGSVGTNYVFSLSTVFPAAFLNQSVKIIEGSGTINDPYVLSL